MAVWVHFGFQLDSLEKKVIRLALKTVYIGVVPHGALPKKRYAVSEHKLPNTLGKEKFLCVSQAQENMYLKFRFS